jgi:hypothetical protein
MAELCSRSLAQNAMTSVVGKTIGTAGVALLELSRTH